MFRTEPYEATTAREIEQHLCLPHLVARILTVRGAKTVEDAERFLYPKLEHLSDPFLLPDVAAGIKALTAAIASGNKIGLFGDYDADGITSTALMVNFLHNFGITPAIYIPGREEGYGLNSQAVKSFAEKGVQLIVCLDCGSSNTPEIETANQAGIGVVILDHHELARPYPPALAVINPKRDDSVFPTRELAACGVTFFFLLALRRAMTQSGLLKRPINLKRQLDLVGVGTVADMVPLISDNRILVKYAMEEMRTRPKQWLKSFYRKVMSYQQKVDAYSLGFIIIPRINAAGRVSRPAIALDFLISTDREESESLLSQLDAANKARRDQEENVIQEATETIKAKSLSDRMSLVLYKDTWPIGVIGIAAQKLAESHGKPCIIFTRVNGTWKGSARGVPGLDLHGTVSTLSSLLLRFGGHKYACGLSLHEENLEIFPDAFEEAVKTNLMGADRTVTVDAVVEFEDLTRELIEYIEMLAPFGVGNPRPLFLLTPTSLSINNRTVRLVDGNSRTWYGNLQKGTLRAELRDAKVVASAVLREEMGEKFVHLYVKEFVME